VSGPLCLAPGGLRSKGSQAIAREGQPLQATFTGWPKEQSPSQNGTLPWPQIIPGILGSKISLYLSNFSFLLAQLSWVVVAYNQKESNRNALKCFHGML
jgi:hypothetical protein